MDPLRDRSCLMSLDAVVVDGANGVCHAPRFFATASPWIAIVIALCELGLALAWLSAIRRGRRALATGIAALVLASLVPGWVALLTVRADRPTALVSAVRTVASVHESGGDHRLVATRDAPVAIDPILRLANITRVGTPIEIRSVEPTLDRSVCTGTDEVTCIDGVAPWRTPWLAPIDLATSLLRLLVPASLGLVLVWLARSRERGRAAVDPLHLASMGLGLTCSFWLSPWLALVVLAMSAYAIRTSPALSPLDSAELRVIAGALVVLAIVVLSRPAWPLFWDEHVWLTRAAAAAFDPRGFVDRALSPSTDLVPRGYPLFAAFATAQLAGFTPTPVALVAASTMVRVLAVAVFIVAVVRHARRSRLREAVAVLGVFFAAPLVFAHLRSGQWDISVGVLSATVLLSLLDGQLALATSSAVLVSGIKDEGSVHVIAVCLAYAFVHRGERDRRWLLPLAAAVAVAGTHRILVALHGAANDDHSVRTVAFGFFDDLPRLVVLHATDVVTWGLLPAVALVALARAARLRTTPLTAPTRTLLTALAFVLVADVLALLLGPDQVREFALEGTLLNRLALESLPLLLVAAPELFAMPAPRALASRIEDGSVGALTSQH